MTVAVNAGNVPTNRVDATGQTHAEAECDGEVRKRRHRLHRMIFSARPLFSPPEPQGVGQFGFVGRAILPAAGFQPALAA
jgi:hypothetical protein